MGLFLAVARSFSVFQASRLDPDSSHYPIQSVPGTLIPGVKQSGRETEYSALSGAEFENEWSRNFTSPMPSLRAQEQLCI